MTILGDDRREHGPAERGARGGTPAACIVHPVRDPLRFFRSLSLAVSVVALPVVAAACSSTTPSASPSSTTPSSTTTTGAGGNGVGKKPVCSLIPPSDIKTTLGVTVSPATATVQSTIATCTYKAADISQSVIIEYQTGATSASFAADKSAIESQFGPTSSVSGIGDQAYSAEKMSGKQTVATVVAISGSLQIVVISASPVYKVENMASKVLYQLESTASSSASTTPTTS